MIDLGAIDDYELSKSILADPDLPGILRDGNLSDAGHALEIRVQDSMTPSEYWELLKTEVHKLVCDDSATEYEELRQTAREAADVGQESWVTYNLRCNSQNFKYRGCHNNTFCCLAIAFSHSFERWGMVQPFQRVD